MMFDFSDSKSGRPSAARIVAAWKRAGRPKRFAVKYGETEAVFERYAYGWADSGNGGRGVDRAAVVRMLAAADDVSKA